MLTGGLEIICTHDTQAGRNFEVLEYIYKDLFTHKDINTYINGVVRICLNKFFFENTGFQKKRCKRNH